MARPVSAVFVQLLFWSRCHREIRIRAFFNIEMGEKKGKNRDVYDELPVTALLTREALQMIDVRPRAHHHLECRDGLAARGAVSGVTE